MLDGQMLDGQMLVSSVGVYIGGCHMKALVYTGPNSLEIRDEPDPVASGEDVVVRVDSVGICGSGRREN